MTQLRSRIAIIGAGIAGCACARQLALAGFHPTLFDKSRGAGGRMATRRGKRIDAGGTPRPFAFDHGAQYFTARHPDFIALVTAGIRAGWIAPWAPRIGGAAHSDTRYVAVPAMPALARQLANDLPLHTEFTVDALHRALADGQPSWRLGAGDGLHPEAFDAVILAMPAAQAAALLAPHRPDWATAALTAPMLPCWTLMAVTAEPFWPHDALRPAQGPLAWIARNDSKPGRPREPGCAHWIAQATPEWSREHLELEPDAAQALLLAALREAIGPAAARVALHFAAVHRWRYARPDDASTVATGAPWWDAALGLGACGDFLGGGRVEAAFLNGDALARLIVAG